MKKVVIILLALVLLYVGVRMFAELTSNNYILKDELSRTQTELQQTEKELAKREAVITDVQTKKVIMERTRQQALNFNNEIKVQAELIVLSLTGTYDIRHDRTPDNPWYDFVIGSEANVAMEFRAGISMPTEFIWANVDPDGKMTIYYNPEKMKIAYIELTELGATESCAILGTQYTAEEISALTMIGKDDIKSGLQSRADFFEQAEENLISEINRVVRVFTNEEVEVTRYR